MARIMFALKNSADALTAWLRRLAILTITSALVATYAAAGTSEGSPANAPIVALAYDGGDQALLKSDEKALYKSGDDGQTWQVIPLPPSTDGKVAAIATPASSKGSVYVAGSGLGVVRTEDNGGHWTAVSEGLPSSNVTAFITHSTQPGTLYAYVPESGIYRSQNAGKSWRLMDRGPEGMSHLIHSSMAGSMESGWLYAATKEGVQLAMDCFCFWRDAGGLGGTVRAISFDPGEPKLVYVAMQRRLFRSTDGGQTWKPATSPGSIVTALMVGAGGLLYAATEDGKLNRSADQATTWEGVGD